MPSLKRIIPAFCFCLLMAFCAVSAKADSIYTYTGKPFTTNRPPTTCPPYCSIQGFFTVATPLGANFSGDVNYISFAFVEPTFTITQANSFVDLFVARTDRTGAIDAWSIALQEKGGHFFVLGTTFIPEDFFLQIDTLFDATTHTNAFNQHDPGTWTVSTRGTAVPEPASGALLMAGLVGLAGLALKKSL